MVEPPAQTGSQNLKPLLVGVLTGPTIWSVHLIASYALVSVGCMTGFGGISFLGLAVTQLLVLGLTLIAVVVVFAAGRPAYRRWRETSGSLDSRTHNLPGFLALLGLLSSGLFGTVVIVMGLPALFYRYPC